MKPETARDRIAIRELFDSIETARTRNAQHRYISQRGIIVNVHREASSSNYILFCDTRSFINSDQLKVTIESLLKLEQSRHAPTREQRASFNNFPRRSAAIVNFLHAALQAIVG